MDLANKVVVVTGGGSGLGRALCLAAHAEGARGIVAGDILGERVRATASETGGVAVECDVSTREGVDLLIAATRDHYGEIDVYFSSAGYTGGQDLFASDLEWQYQWQLHHMAHVYAAQALVPAWQRRGRGQLVIVASGAALSPMPGDAPYISSKAAAVALAEFLAIEYSSSGIGIAVVCPGGMRTELAYKFCDETTKHLWEPTLMEPEDAAQAVLQGLRDGHLLIYTHPDSQKLFIRKATDHDRWLDWSRKTLGR